MSIRDEDDTDVVKLKGVWELLFKIGMLSFVPFTGAVLGLFIWLVVTIFDHDTRITVLERMAIHKADNGSNSGNSTATIITGDASKLASEQAERKGYLTTEEFAQRIGKDRRTVLTYIAEGKISPAPVQDGREWRLAVDSRLQPQIAATSGKPEEPEPP